MVSTIEIMPQPEPNGFIATLNQQGYMTSTVDKFMQAFIDYSSTCECPCVDIGAAYGIATIEALKKGASIIANDIDGRHLEILKNQVPDKLKKRLQLLQGTFPNDLDFLSDSIGGFLIARVAHFLQPHELEDAAFKLYSWLVPKGKIFLTAETPYLGLWKTFIPIYEQKKLEGNIWAGEISDVSKYAPHRSDQLPKRMLVLDPDILRYVFEKAGFFIDIVDFFARPEFPEDLRLNNKESVGLICTKQ